MFPLRSQVQIISFAIVKYPWYKLKLVFTQSSHHELDVMQVQFLSIVKRVLIQTN